MSTGAKIIPEYCFAPASTSPSVMSGLSGSTMLETGLSSLEISFETCSTSRSFPFSFPLSFLILRLLELPPLDPEAALVEEDETSEAEIETFSQTASLIILRFEFWTGGVLSLGRWEFLRGRGGGWRDRGVVEEEGLRGERGRGKGGAGSNGDGSE